MDYVERLQKANRLAEPLLDRMKAMCTEREFKGLLYKYILARLMLPEDVNEHDLYQLCLMSIKQQRNHFFADNAQALDAQLKKYDCHQQNAPAQKKVLLIMRLEKELDCILTADEAVGCKTTETLAKTFYRKLQERGIDR